MQKASEKERDQELKIRQDKQWDTPLFLCVFSVAIAYFKVRSRAVTPQMLIHETKAHWTGLGRFSFYSKFVEKTIHLAQIWERIPFVQIAKVSSMFMCSFHSCF